MVLCEMGNEEEDESLLPELEEEYNALIQSVGIRQAADPAHRGSTTPPTPFWPSMPVPAERKPRTGPKCFYRMYTRWAERHGFSYKVMDYQEGDEAGLKSATIMIEGGNAYGYLRGEHGVHRLVRVSPLTPMPAGRLPSPPWR